jgi:hypothetical protein
VARDADSPGPLKSREARTRSDFACRYEEDKAVHELPDIGKKDFVGRKRPYSGTGWLITPSRGSRSPQFISTLAIEHQTEVRRSNKSIPEIWTVATLMRRLAE